ncbi:MAG TPA: hypothetical protein VJG83_03175 [archaeon]|nr:hypothetical protein [archaeon]
MAIPKALRKFFSFGRNTQRSTISKRAKKAAIAGGVALSLTAAGALGIHGVRNAKWQRAPVQMQQIAKIELLRGKGNPGIRDVKRVADTISANWKEYKRDGFGKMSERLIGERNKWPQATPEHERYNNILNIMDSYDKLAPNVKLKFNEFLGLK